MLILISILAGVVTGIFTGIIPAVHINTVAFFFSSLTFTKYFEEVAVFLVSMSISHNFFDFVPAIIFGSGEEGSALSTFIGNKLFMKGEGFKALKLTAYGGLVGCACFLTLLPVLAVILPLTFTFLSNYAWIILVGIETHLLMKDSKKSAVLVFALSGFLGLFALNAGMNSPLLSLFSGLFGLGVMWGSYKLDAGKQIDSYGLPVTKKDIAKSGFIGVISSIVLGIVPAIGPTQASVAVYSEKDDESFLIRLGAINVTDVFISLLALFFIGKARSGVLVAMQDFFNMNAESLVVLFASGLLASVLSFYLCIKVGRRILNAAGKMDYRKLVILAVSFILVINLLSNGVLGLIVCLAGAMISRIAIKSNIMKSHCMGCLMLPTILFYLKAFT